MKEQIIATREYREKLLKDPYRPVYHFAIPDDDGRPGDSNGAFFADGIYHLMYLYRNSKTEGFHWGHMSSLDLLHWRHHADALTVYEGDKGCFSGGAFVDDDKTVYLTFWKFPAVDPQKDKSGIAIAYAKPPYEKWERLEPIAVNATEWGIKDIEVDGEIIHLGCADPSNIWKMNGYYYMQLGNLAVLNHYGRKEDSSEKYQGDWTELFRSADLKKWEYVHRFYINPHMGEDWPDRTEDDMCPSFLPLYDKKSGGRVTDKWLQLFISHNKGCQYYVGTLDEKKEIFTPQVHGRMSWKDNTYFAPEALIDDKNRHIIWTWLHHSNIETEMTERGWTGVFGFPRVVWWEEEELRMAPAEELDRLQYNHQAFEQLESDRILVKNGELFRIRASWKADAVTRAGIKVRVSPDKEEYTEIYVDKAAGKLCVDTTKSGYMGRRILEEAPFSFKEGEDLHLDIFVDKSIVEVYANERQAICRRIWPSDPVNATGVYTCGEKMPYRLEVWEMAPTNPY